MTVVVTQNNGNAASQYASGHRSGTYTAADFTITLGFVPRYVKVMNLTDRVCAEWYEGMAFGDYVKTAANGTVTLETDNAFEVASVGTGNQTGGAGTPQAGTQIINDNTSTQQVGEAPAATVFVDVSVAGLATDNDEVIWEARA